MIEKEKKDMTKHDFVKRVSDIVKEQGFSGTLKETAAYIDAFTEAVTGAMAEREEVSLTGFAKFYVEEVAPRKARNPRTGEAVDIPARDRVKIKILSGLKQSVQ